MTKKPLDERRHNFNRRCRSNTQNKKQYLEKTIQYEEYTEKKKNMINWNT